MATRRSSRAQRRSGNAPQRPISSSIQPITAEPISTPDASIARLQQPQLGAATRNAAAIDLQRTLGNKQVERLIGGRAGGADTATVPHRHHPNSALLARAPDADPAQDAARQQAAADLLRFRAQDYDLKNHHPSTGRGLFDVHYAPNTGDLAIALKVCFKFVSGDKTDASWVASVGGPAAAAAFADAQFQWKPDETTAWKTTAVSDVQSAWSERFTFHNTQPFWEALPDVNVHVNVVESAEKDAHFVTTVRKWPKDGGPLDGVTPPGTANQSTATFEESADNGITTPDVDKHTITTASDPAYAAIDTANPQQIFFKIGHSEVTAADQAKLRTFGQTLGRPEMPPFPVTVTGRASTDGGQNRNQTLSEDRARAVSNEIVSGGPQTQPTSVAKGIDGADATPRSRRADVMVEPLKTSQTTVKHEFGHMLGLGDEYGNVGAGRPVGTKVAHSALAEKLIPGQQPILASDTDNIMSQGETLKPHHYVTFLEALGTASHSEGKWNIGPGPHDRPDPNTA